VSFVLKIQFRDASIGCRVQVSFASNALTCRSLDTFERKGLCPAGRHRQSQGGISGFPRSLEKRRSRYPSPEGGHGGVREAAV